MAARSLERSLEKFARHHFVNPNSQSIEEFRDRLADTYVAADRGFADAVIQPRETA